MFLSIEISSKDVKKLKKFSKFLQKHKYFSFFDFKSEMLKRKKMIITTLKSPHVNKVAQEQFEIRIVKRKIRIFALRILACFFLLKEIRTHIFPELKFKISSNLSPANNFLNSPFQYLIDPRFFFLRNRINRKKKRIKKLYKYLQLFDGYGEFAVRCLKKN